MSKIKINDIIEVEGAVSARQEIQTVGGAKILVTNGILQCEDYYPKITKISCSRFALYGVNIKSENFGSEDENISYEFTFDRIEVKKK